LHNTPIKTIFVCEFITAGGFNHADLPESLAFEGALMRDALLRDLSHLPYKISTTIDSRIAPPNHCHTCTVVEAYDDVWQVWEQAMSVADAVWLIAPETNGLLKRLTELAVSHHKTILGCGLQSIEITASKLATYFALKQAGIDTIPTFIFKNWKKEVGVWLAKPDDGAGCDSTVCFESADEMAGWLSSYNKAGSHVIQPFQAGTPASISCVMYHGKAQVLSCNKQLIEIKNNQLRCFELSYRGSVANGMCEYWAEFEMIANKIAQAMPDLAGYVGVDVIVDGDEVIVVEINPRLTTSYVALAQAISKNPAELIINTLTQDNFNWPKLERNVIEINV